jgi:hypothetical protein
MKKISSKNIPLILMSINNISNNFKKIMDDLYDLYFQFNDKYCKIHIHYNSINNLCTKKTT